MFKFYKCYKSNLSQQISRNNNTMAPQFCAIITCTLQLSHFLSNILTLDWPASHWQVQRGLDILMCLYSLQVGCWERCSTFSTTGSPFSGSGKVSIVYPGSQVVIFLLKITSWVHVFFYLSQAHHGYFIERWQRYFFMSYKKTNFLMVTSIFITITTTITIINRNHFLILWHIFQGTQIADIETH